MKTKNDHDDATAKHLRLLVRVLQDVVARESFETYADLAETFKRRLAQLRLAYDSSIVSAALDQLERGGRRPLVVVAQPRVVSLRERDQPDDKLSQADAVACVALLQDRFPDCPLWRRTRST